VGWCSVACPRLIKPYLGSDLGLPSDNLSIYFPYPFIIISRPNFVVVFPWPRTVGTALAPVLKLVLLLLVPSATCRDTYGLPDSSYTRKGPEETRALCTAEYSDISPLTGGNVAFSTLEGRPSAYNFDASPELQVCRLFPRVHTRIIVCVCVFVCLFFCLFVCARFKVYTKIAKNFMIEVRIIYQTVQDLSGQIGCFYAFLNVRGL
jgi:hypothetical protein